MAAKPASLDFQQAASLPHAALTAWRALVDSAGQRELILGASGGVGVAAVQLAKARGAWVAGVASTRNMLLLRELGADEAIDYSTQEFDRLVSDVDVVIDAVSGEIQERAWKTLKPGGILVSLIQTPSAEAAAAHGVRGVVGAAMPPAGPVLGEIGKLADSGKLRPVISSVLPLAETNRALGMVATRHTGGRSSCR